MLLFQLHDLDNILIDEKSCKNILVYSISEKTFIVTKTLRVRFSKIDMDLLDFMMELHV